MDCSSPNFVNRQKNNIENLTNFSEFDTILIYIFIFICKIVSSLKINIFRRGKTFYHFLIIDENQSEFPSRENILFEMKNEYKVNMIIKEIKDDNNEIKGNKIKKRKYNINKNNIIIRHYIIIIKLILINIIY